MSLPRELAQYVASLVAYDEDLGEPGRHIGMPSTVLTLVLPLEEPLDVGWGGRPGSRTRSWASVSGLHDVPAEIHHDGRQRGIQLGLTVAGARVLLGVPAAALAGHLLDLGDVDPVLGELPERLADAPAAAHVGMVKRALVAATGRHDAHGPRAEVARALDRLGRGARVADVADEVGFSRRHLGDLVRAETGVSPKTYQRLARFAVGHGLARDPARSLADVASGAGYADQSHLTREWTALASCSPGEWRRRELPFVQDDQLGSRAG